MSAVLFEFFNTDEISMSIFKNCSKPIEGEPLVVYELNEVPWRVVDWYVQSKPNSALGQLLGGAQTYTTFTRDEGELHPWTTWPTLHRGVTNRQHHIRFINQDLTVAASYPPLWETLVGAGKRVGVFGSLQSYPPPLQNNYEFYVPDTFAPGWETIPARYEGFQRFNLRQTQQDGAQAAPIQFDGSVASDVVQMMQAGLGFGTCGKLAWHIAKERVNPLYRTRRSVMQALVSFDIFRHALKSTRPDFCTFFTNHVAGMMHRYWKHTFPQDFNAVLTTAEEKFHAGSVGYAMDVADSQLASLMAYVNGNGGRLIVASSMGQESIDRGEYFGEWRITDVHLFLRAIGWQKPARDLLAMQPDFNFSFDSDADAEEFLNIAKRLVDIRGETVWNRAQRTASTVNLGLSPSRSATESGQVGLKSHFGPPTQLTIGELGIQFLKRDPGTGYHQPRGILILAGNGVPRDDSRREVDSTSVRPAILQLLGV